MISSKEKLNKKNKIGAAFTDDGFAMGLSPFIIYYFWLLLLLFTKILIPAVPFAVQC